MKGARSTLKCKGYLLTALATAVLLAASSGTALAQRTNALPVLTDLKIELTGPNDVGEARTR